MKLKGGSNYVVEVATVLCGGAGDCGRVVGLRAIVLILTVGEGGGAC